MTEQQAPQIVQDFIQIRRKFIAELEDRRRRGEDVYAYVWVDIRAHMRDFADGLSAEDRDALDQWEEAGHPGLKTEPSRETDPIRIHKNLLIRALENNPEGLAMVFPDGPYKTAHEAISALKNNPGQWIVNGVLAPEKTES